jgi:HAD superfamily hydrolase (TIGR01490 family)
MKLTLFDLDNTLLAGDSDFEWGRFLVDMGIVDRDHYELKNQAFYEDYKAGRLDIHAFAAFAFEPLTRHTRAELDAWHARYMAERVRPLVAPGARALVDARLRDSDLVAVITATNSFVTAPIARELGIAHLVATDPEQIDGRYTGRIAGIPCFREGKVARVHAWLESLGHHWQDVRESWFYSDSLNDLPLLEHVTHPIAVDPDPTLRAHAEAHGWTVISLRG